MRKFLPQNLGLVRAMEDDDTVVEPPKDDIGDNAESVETDLAEVTESETDGDAAEAQIDDAAEVSEALEQYKAAMESAIATGGLDRNGGMMMKIGVESLYARVGISSKKRATISQESFGQVSSKLGATQVALEDIKEQLKKIWDSIVAAVKKAVAWVKDHFMKVFGTAEKLQKRAKALAEKAGSITGAAKEKTFENERLVKALHVAGAVSATPTVELQKVKKVAEVVFGQISDFSAKNGEALLNQLEGPTDKIDDLWTRKEIPQNTSIVSNPDGEGFGDPGDNMAMYRSVEMLGGKALVARTASKDLSGTEGISAASRATTSISPFSPKAKEPTKNDVTTLNPSEASKAADAVADLAGEVITYKAKLSKLNDIQSKIAAAAEKLGKTAKEGDDKDVAAYTAGLQKFAHAVPLNMTRCAAGMGGYILNTGKAVCDYIELSLKQYA